MMIPAKGELKLTILLGFLVGAFVSIIGGGGASLYLGILTSQLHIPVAVAAPTSLLIAFPALFAGWLTQLRIKNIDFHYAWQMIIASIPGILGGTWVAKYLSTAVYNWVVGLILISMGLLVEVKAFRQKATPDQPAKDHPWLARGLGVLSGLMVGIGGLSGGAPTVAGLTILGLPAFRAAGTTTFVLWAMSSIGLVSHLFTSHFAWRAGLGIMVGAIAASILTPLVLNRFDYRRFNRYLTPVLGLIIIYFGLKMII